MSHSGKYTLIEVDGDQDAEVKVFSLIIFEVLEVFKRITHLTINNILCFIQVDTVDGGDVKVKIEQHVLPCALDEATQRLIRFIFKQRHVQRSHDEHEPGLVLNYCVPVLLFLSIALLLWFFLIIEKNKLYLLKPYEDHSGFISHFTCFWGHRGDLAMWLWTEDVTFCCLFESCLPLSESCLYH